MSHAQWTDYNEHDPGISQNVMPDWFKTNAKWWKDGLITDADMINALESLMVQDIIPLDRFVQSSDLEDVSNVPKGEPSIPSYQKDVFGFWGEGIISDDEIVNAIGHLMTKGIINSEKIQKEVSERQEKFENAFGASGLVDKTSKEFGIDSRWGATECADDNVCDADKGEVCAKRDGTTEGKCIPTWFGIEHAWAPLELMPSAKSNELAMTYLQKIKSGEYESIKKSYEQSLDAYSENKDQNSMNEMIELGNLEKKAKEDSHRSTEILKSTTIFSENAKKIAIKSGFNVLDLEKSVERQQSEIDSMDKTFETKSELKSAHKDAQKAQKQANEDLQDVLLSIISESPEFQKLSRTDQNFVSEKINGIEYSDFKIDSFSKKKSSSNTVPTKNTIHSMATPEGQMILFFIDTLSNEDGAEIFIEYFERGEPELPPVNSDFTESSTSFDGGFFVIVNEDANPSDNLVDPLVPSNDDDSSWVYGSSGFFMGITLPNGNIMTILQKYPKGTLDQILNPDVIEGHKMISTDPSSPSILECPSCSGEIAPHGLCVNCGEEFVESEVEIGTSADSCQTCLEVGEHGLCVVCGDEHESENYSTTYDETEPETSTEPEDDGFTESGDVYVNGPYVNYNSGIVTLIVGNERHEFDTMNDALLALDDLIAKFKATHSPQSTTESNSDGNYKWEISAIKIGNLVFPAYQFMLSPPDDGCSESYLKPGPWHSDYHNIAFQLDPFATPVPWIPGGCGSFAKESQYTHNDHYPITDEQATIWEETFGTSMKYMPYSP